MLSRNRIEPDIYFIGICTSVGNAFQYYNDQGITWTTFLITLPVLYIVVKWLRKRWRIVIKNKGDYN